jgi:hypothetical protein
MARQVSNVDIITDTWEIVVLKTNELLNSLSTEVITANSTVALTGNTDSPRNAELIGSFSANTIAVTNGLRGGNTSAAANLVITSNVSFTGAALTSSAAGTFTAPQAFSNTITFSSASFTSTSNTYINAANVTVNSAAQTFKAGTVNALAITNDGTTTAVTVAGNTFTVSSNVSITGTSHSIAGNVNFDSGTLIINGTSNIVNATSLGLSGIISVAGNGSVGGIFTSTGNTSLAGGLVNVTSSGTAVSGNVNFDSGTFVINATDNVVNAASLGVTGVTTLSGNTTVSSNVTMNGIVTIANTSSHSGAATFANTVGITGATTLSNTVNVVGAANLQSSANVGGTLGVAGVATLAGNASVGGIFSVTGNTTVTRLAAGNTTVTGSFTVTANTTANNIQVTNGTSSSNITPTSVSTNNVTTRTITANGTIGTTGQILISNGSGVYWGGVDFAQAAFTTLSANNLSANVASFGNTTVSGWLNATSSAAIGGTMVVTGNSTFSDRISVTNLAQLSGGANTTTITATGVTVGNVAVGTNSLIVGNSTVNTSITSTAVFTSGTLDVTGNTSISDRLTVSGIATLSQSLGVTGNTSVGGILSVTGATTMAALTASGAAALNGGLTTSTANATTSMAVGSNVNITTARITVGNSSVNSFFTATGIETDGTLTVAGNTGFSGNVSFGSAAGIIANGSIGTTGQVLTSNGTTVYWTTPVTGDITAVSAGNGMTGGGTSGDVTLTVLANNGITANSTGVFVRANTGLVANSTGLFVDPAANFTNTSGTYTITGARTMNANLTLGTVAALIANGSSGTAGQVLYSNGTTAYWASVSQGLTAGNGLTSNATHYAVLANNGIVANSTGTFVLANTGLFTNATGVYVNASAISLGTLPDATLPNTAVTTGTYGSGSLVPVITVDAKGRITSVSTSSISAGAVTAGANTQLQFNDSGGLGASAGFTFNKSTNNVTIANTLTVGTATVNSTIYSGTANNATNFGGQAASYYANASNLTDGTLAYARLPSGLVNTSASFTFTANQTFNANVVIASGLVANSSRGTAGQVLASNGTSVYWSDPLVGDITAVTAGNGLTGGGTSGDVSLSVRANTGLFTNATGVYVNASAITIGTLPSGTLPTSGATAGSYGTGSLIPVITVDDKGRITDISTTTSTPGAAQPGGSNTQIQFNDSGSLGATAGFSFNKSTNNVTIANTLTIGTATITSTNYSGTANNANNLGGQAPSYYLDSQNLTGTLPYGRIPSNIVNTTSSFTFSASQTFSANVVVSGGLVANSSRGTAGQVLTSNGTTVYWSDPGDITEIGVGFGMTGGGDAGTVNIGLQTADGVFANASGLYVNASAVSVGTLPYGRIPSNIVNTSSSFTFSAQQTFSANVGISGTLAVQGGVYAYATLTTASTLQATLATTALRSATFMIEGVDSTGSKFQKTTINAIHNGSSANHVEYGNINIGGDVAIFTVDYSSGIRLRVTPITTNSTVFKVVIIAT